MAYLQVHLDRLDRDAATSPWPLPHLPTVRLSSRSLLSLSVSSSPGPSLLLLKPAPSSLATTTLLSSVPAHSPFPSMCTSCGGEGDHTCWVAGRACGYSQGNNPHFFTSNPHVLTSYRSQAHLQLLVRSPDYTRDHRRLQLSFCSPPPRPKLRLPPPLSPPLSPSLPSTPVKPPSQQ